LRRQRFAEALRASGHALAIGLATLLVGVIPVSAFDLDLKILPASFSPAIAKVRAQPPLVDRQVELTSELLQAYVDRQQKLKSFDGFDVEPDSSLTETVLLSYIARQRNDALEAIEDAEIERKRALTADVLVEYAQDSFVPTVKRLKQAEDEVLCLTQAIYHEARGESESGQLAVVNIIINRAMSKKYPNTICGVVFQNADKGRYRCQFTFACDGRSDFGTERKAWNRAAKLAGDAYREYRIGQRPGVLPSSAMYYHTTAVAPKWSHTFRRVAAIGSHVFYASN